MTKSDVSSADEGYFMKKIYKKRVRKKITSNVILQRRKLKDFHQFSGRIVSNVLLHAKLQSKNNNGNKAFINGKII